MDLFTKQYHAPGTMPGTLSTDVQGEFSLTLVDYDPESFVEKTDLNPRECKTYVETPKLTWIHIQGSPTPDALIELAELFDLHALHLEDILNAGQRPKLDIIDQNAFAILCLPNVSENKTRVNQVCIFLGNDYVISLCSGNENPFGLVYDRLRQAIGTLRKRKSDYLFYTLIDAVIDHGFPILEFYAERIETIEDKLIEQPSNALLQELHQLRRELLFLRRRLWPHREVMNKLLRDGETELVQDKTRVYLRDCYDHTISILELLETYREMTAGMLEVYLSSLSHRLNNVMRVLTIIATLFIPPTFVVGVYGMNFDRQAGALSMPELHWPYGYVMVWFIILVMIGGMLLYFRRQRWF